MREEQRAPRRCKLAARSHVVPVGELRDQVGVPRKIPADRPGWRREPAVRPDDLHLRIVSEKVVERLFVAMRMQPEAAGHGERDDALQLFRVGIAAEDVEFADAAPADVARQLVLDQRVYRRIAEPSVAVGGRAVRPDERDHSGRVPRAGAGGRGQQTRSVVGAAGGQDRAHMAVAEACHDSRDRIGTLCLFVVMQVCVEDRQRRGRAAGKRRDADQGGRCAGDQRNWACGAHVGTGVDRRQCPTAPPATEARAAPRRPPADGAARGARAVCGRFRVPNNVAAHAAQQRNTPLSPNEKTMREAFPSCGNAV